MNEMRNSGGERNQVDFQAREVREVANAIDPSGRKLVERRHSGTVRVIVDGGEGGGREVNPVGVIEEERVDI